MSKTEELPNRLEEAVRKADEAFWRVIVEEYPEAVSGDFDPGEAAELRQKQTSAVGHWLNWNVPNQSD